MDPVLPVSTARELGVRVPSGSARTGASFAHALSKATGGLEGPAPDVQVDAATGAVQAPDPQRTLKAVAGHDYAKITSGEDKGLFVNQAGGERDGETFRRVIRDGREFHVYGTGKDAVVVRLHGT